MIPTLLFLILLGQSNAPAAAQPSASNTERAALARGWTALAAGRTAEAGRIAAQLLTKQPWSHAAIELSISAQAVESPIKALDAYERWLGQRPDDPGLLEPISVAVLTQLADNSDPALASEARKLLAQPGPAESGAPQKSEVERRRLEEALRSDVPDKTATAEALGESGPAAIPALTEFLQASHGPNRAAAAKALGKLQARDAEASLLDAMKDEDPFVRSSAAVALARIGNATGTEYVGQMLASPVPSVRLMAAEAWNGAPGPWVEAIRPLLKDDNALVRVRAAALLAPVDPESSRETLSNSLADKNPVIRAESGKRLASLMPREADVADVARLRRNLREQDPWVRLYAAGALLRLIRGTNR